MSEQKESIGHWDNSDMTTSSNPQISAIPLPNYETTNIWHHVSNPQPAPVVSLLSQLNEKSLADVRQIVREEIEAALMQHDKRGLDRLLTDIHRTAPLPEQEEMAAYLVTLSADEWHALVELVNERRRGE